MNSVQNIHLGRQPFNISAEAHQNLKNYLVDIKKKVGDAEVVDEVELRMSELLAERGISGEKVILPNDVEFLKQQLGSPEDFSDQSGDVEQPEEPTTKRLFRDTDNAIVAGVAAGLGSFFGIDPALVRIIFVVLTIFTGGLWIVLYVLLWLLVPPAVTTSEKLQMQGKPVNLEALKNSVSQADLSGTARRATNSVAPIIDGIFRFAVKLVGVGFMILGILLIVLDGIIRAYMDLHNGRLFQEGIFPVGLREEWLLGISQVLAIIVAIFLMLAGLATFKRKWPVRGWLTGVLAALFIVGAAAGLALAADVSPRVRDRYEATLHTTAVQNVQPFSSIVTYGDVDIAYISAPNYAVNIQYSGNPNLSKVKVYVRNNTLYIDSRSLDQAPHCTMLCLFPRYNMVVQIYAPNVKQFITPPHSDIFYPAPPRLIN